MKLKNVIENLEFLSEDGTVFAEKINGKFRPDSEAQLVEMAEEELEREKMKIAELKSQGFEYFLEVFIIREIIEGWQINHDGNLPSIEAALENIIFYAENDAYPESFFD
jgi:hypothetical protein